MAWKVEFSTEADRELGKLDAQHRTRILRFLHEQIANLDDPRSLGQALHGSRLGEFGKYRVGPYRLICRIEDNLLVVLVLRIGHRKEIYRGGEVFRSQPKNRPGPSLPVGLERQRRKPCVR